MIQNFLIFIIVLITSAYANADEAYVYDHNSCNQAFSIITAKENFLSRADKKINYFNYLITQSSSSRASMDKLERDVNRVLKRREKLLSLGADESNLNLAKVKAFFGNTQSLKNIKLLTSINTRRDKKLSQMLEELNRSVFLFNKITQITSDYAYEIAYSNFIKDYPSETEAAIYNPVFLDYYSKAVYEIYVQSTTLDIANNIKAIFHQNEALYNWWNLFLQNTDLNSPDALQKIDNHISAKINYLTEELNDAKAQLLSAEKTETIAALIKQKQDLSQQLAILKSVL